jgi:hypothetical protein
LKSKDPLPPIKPMVSTILILGVLGISMFLSIQNFLEYFAYEVVSHYKVIQTAELPFPAVKFSPTYGVEEISCFYCNFQGKNCSLRQDNNNSKVYFFNFDKSYIINYNTYMAKGLYLKFNVTISNNSQGWLAIDIKFFSPFPTYSSFFSSESLASLGQDTRIIISRTERTILPKPFSNCIQTNSEYNIDNTIKSKMKMLNLSRNDQYLQHICMSECSKIYGNGFLNDSKAVNKCIEFCPVKCNQVFFNTETSSILLKPTYNSSNQVNVNIRYGSESYVSITESRKVTTTSLLISFVAVLGFFSTGCKYANLIVDLFYDIFKSLAPMIN